mgnify:CR=1 FL=1
MSKIIKIANGQGFWGDSVNAPIELVNNAKIDYLTLDYLAEVTMAIMQKQFNKNPNRGYAYDFVDFIEGVKQDINQENKLNNVEEMVQNISIMITAGKGFLKDLEQFNYILQEIEQFSNMNHKKYPSLSSKIVFKFMDLSEELED